MGVDEVVGVDQFSGGPLAVSQRVLEGVLGVDDADASQQVPGGVGAHIGFAAVAAGDSTQVEDVFAGECFQILSRMQDDRGDHPQALVDVPWRHAEFGPVLGMRSDQFVPGGALTLRNTARRAS
ncbi:hypothetical protein ACFW9I_35920 [[Kitasatospora] papulosa]|uniref:hypothetical protein n=1 Tax=[Kitasatospora] papulosa TaxID=1464011 RepID=UPI00369567DC